MTSHKTFFGDATEIVVYDTEFTTWKGAIQRGWSGDDEHRELVQIAAQKINLVQRSVVDSLEIFIQPRINRQLSNYFTELTHITQADIESKGVDFLTAYEQLLSWSAGFDMYAYSGHKGVESMADGEVIQENLELYKLNNDFPAQRFKNIASFFRAAGIDTTQYSSGELHKAFALSLNGHVHNAMHDVDSLVTALFYVLEQ